MRAPNGWVVGARVKCPKCGKEGKVGISTFKAKGKEYTYWVVNHPEARKCVISRVRGAAPAAAETAPPVFTEEKEAPAEEAAPVFREWGPIPAAVDKAAWYAVKIAASWGSCRENPTEENFRRFATTARQIAQRCGVPVEDAISAVEHYVKVGSEQAKVTANEAVKRVIARVIVANTAAFEGFAEEARRRIEEAVRKIEEASKIPEVKVSAEEVKAAFAVFRVKKKVPEEVRAKAYRTWDAIFAPGKKIVAVEG